MLLHWQYCHLRYSEVMQGQLQPGVKFRLAGTCMPVYDMWRNVSSGFDIGPTYRPIWSCRYQLSCSDSYQTDISVLLHIKSIRIIGLNRLFTGIILYLDYPNLIREVLQLLRKSITVVVRFLIPLTSTTFCFRVIALSNSGTWVQFSSRRRWISIATFNFCADTC